MGCSAAQITQTHDSAERLPGKRDFTYLDGFSLQHIFWASALIELASVCVGGREICLIYEPTRLLIGLSPPAQYLYAPFGRKTTW